MAGQELLAELDGIAIGAATGRRASAPLQMAFLRELTEGDLELVLHPPGIGLDVVPILRIKNTHHTAARLIAEGKRNIEVSAITGYSPAWVSTMQRDPSFKELVAYYRENAEAQFIDFHARLAALGLATLEELQDRLEVEPDKFSNRELLEMAEMALDRSVTPGAKGGGAGQGQGAPAVVSITFVTPEPRERPGLGTVIDVEAVL